MTRALTRSKSRIKLLVLGLVGFGPLLLAYTIYFYFPDLLPSSTTNHGELIDPPIFIDEAKTSNDLEGSWALILIEDQCADDCEQLRYLATQVVKGLGKDSERVRNVVIQDLSLSTNEKSLVNDNFLYFTSGKVAELALISNGRPGLFLKDPNGNVILFYATDKAGKPMLKDLKHLLKLSNIG